MNVSDSVDVELGEGEAELGLICGCGSLWVSGGPGFSQQGRVVISKRHAELSHWYWSGKLDLGGDRCFHALRISFYRLATPTLTCCLWPTRSDSDCLTHTRTPLSDCTRSGIYLLIRASISPPLGGRWTCGGEGARFFSKHMLSLVTVRQH